MTTNKVYHVMYKEHSASDPIGVDVLAKNKMEAYLKILDRFNPYSAWVVSVTYQNGNHREFNNIEGWGY